jgi:hypothetical protein
MHNRKQIVLPRNVKLALEWVATIGAALLASYLILRVPW